jgi:hypothetical protein
VHTPDERLQVRPEGGFYDGEAGLAKDVKAFLAFVPLRLIFRFPAVNMPLHIGLLTPLDPFFDLPKGLGGCVIKPYDELEAIS